MATGMSEAEARETAEYDYEIEHGGKDLEYDLTKEQQKVAKEISNDLNKKFPMHRLLQGDVDSLPKARPDSHSGLRQA